jgi:signal transduction histidine kinase
LFHPQRRHLVGTWDDANGRGKVTLELRVCDLGETIRTALRTIQEAAQKKGVALRTVEADELLFIEADVDHLQQIFRNVFSNALKFIPAGGALEVAGAKDVSVDKPFDDATLIAAVAAAIARRRL